MSKKITIDVNVDNDQITSSKNKKETYVAIVMDRSGSMSGKEGAAIDSVNKQIKTIKRNAKKGGKTYVTLILFDGEIDVVYDRKPASEIRKITTELYWARGSTSLRDATVKAVKLLKKNRDEDINQGFLVMVVTDGQENSSRISANDFEKKIKKIQKDNAWTLTYLLDGYTESQIRELAINISVPLGNFGSYTSSARGMTNAAPVMVNSVNEYFTSREAGESCTSTFYSADAGKDELTTIDEDGATSTSGNPKFSTTESK